MALSTLSVDGVATLLRVRRADGFRARAIGLLRTPAAGSPEVLLIPRCAAVHTFGMRRAIDVAFADGDGNVLRAVGRLGPWRFAWCLNATMAWELPAGELARLGVLRGARLAMGPPSAAVMPPSHEPSASQSPDPNPSQDASARRSLGRPTAACEAQRRPAVRDLAAHRAGRGTRRARSMRGAAMLEFLVAGMLVLLPLTFATLELAQLAVTQHALDYATFEAARSGAVHGADRATMRRSLARALVPLFAPVDPIATLRAGGGAAAVDPQSAVTALARASAEVLRPDLTRLEIENPTAAAARDFAVVEEGQRVIPNEGLDQRNPLGQQSGQSLREANVLAIRVRYCRRLVMPLIDRVVPALLRLRLLDPLDQSCLAQRRIPIEARAVVHMQSSARVAELDGG